MPDTPILEISRLVEIFEDDTAGIVELLESAMKTGAGYQAALRSGLEKKVLDDVMRALNVEYAKTGKFYDDSGTIRSVAEEIAGMTSRLRRRWRWNKVDGR